MQEIEKHASLLDNDNNEEFYLTSLTQNFFSFHLNDTHFLKEKWNEFSVLFHKHFWHTKLARSNTSSIYNLVQYLESRQPP